MSAQEQAREIVTAWGKAEIGPGWELTEDQPHLIRFADRIAAALAASAAKSVDSTGYIQCSRCGQGSRNQTVIQDDKTSDRWLCIRCVTTERDALKRELEALKK